MEITLENFKEMLVPAGHITEDQFVHATEEAQRKSISFSEELIEEGLITDIDLGKTIADFFDHHFVDLQDVEIQDKFLTYFPEAVAHAQRAIIFAVSDDTLSLATEYIDNYEFFRLLEKKTGKHITVQYATTRGIENALKHYKGDLRNNINALVKVCDTEQEEGDIVRLVNLFLEYANDNHASDIHIEPLENEVLIRFRIDGILHEAVRYPKSLHEKIVFRIKIMSHLQTDEHSAAQDGRFEYHHSQKNTFDVRVSIIPVTDGENIVLRLLDSHTHKFFLENLGLNEADYHKILLSVQRPHGMIIAVGPTGSGKTTVLYTILEKLNDPEINIMTIEDPVEYDMVGIQQIQVNQKKNLTFANGLRSIVRQDPDVIMVGEIRDAETADIAINSALTGHLVISTLHTNDAATTFPRLLEMNVEPFLIASSVNIIIALRLVRKICVQCKESYVPSSTELEMFLQNTKIMEYIETIQKGKDIAQIRLYRGKGCTVCQHTGYSGRVGIFEVLEVDEKIRVLITKKASADVIMKQALESGMLPLLYDGVLKALNGTTTLNEVIKVVGA